jgi:hypothetical protein
MTTLPIVLGGATLLGFFAAPAYAQSAFFSVEGEMIFGGGTIDARFDLLREVSSPELFHIETHSYRGGVSASGETISASGFNAEVELLTFNDVVVGRSHQISDGPDPDLDALISWDHLQALGQPVIDDRLHAGNNYRLNLRSFEQVAGQWSVDLVAPADAIVFNGVTNNGSILSEVASLRFGAEAGGTATYSVVETLNVTFDLDVEAGGLLTGNMADGRGSTVTIDNLSTLVAHVGSSIRFDGLAGLTGESGNRGGFLSASVGTRVSVAGLMSLNGGTAGPTSGGGLVGGEGGEGGRISITFGEFSIDGGMLSLDGGRGGDALLGGRGGDGGRIDISGATGTLSLNGGVVSLRRGSNGNGAVSESASPGRIVVQGGTLTLNAGLIRGTDDAPVGDPIVLLDAVVDIQQGRVVTNAPLAIQGEAALVRLTNGQMNGTTVRLVEGGQFSFTGGTLTIHTFSGDLTNQGGTLAPGNSPGTTVITGHYTQQSGGTLAIELAGTARGSQFDGVDIGGDLDLAGTLNVTLIDGYSPELGDHFDILDWGGTQTGTFDTLLLAELDAGLGWNLRDLHTRGELRVELLGDLNSDGRVGIEDLDLILANWGDTTNPYNYAGGDLSGDGLVSDTDLQAVLDHWGNTVTSMGSTIPEPCTLALLVLSLMSQRRTRRTAASGRAV